MKRVLIVAPAFPPHPSPATHRARFLARYGPRYGWDVGVLSVRPEYYEERPDSELLRLVPPGLEITRTPAFRTSWTRRLGVGDLGMRSYFPMRRELRRLCRARRPDVIFIPLSPWHTSLLGADMREELGIPYVLDFTDPWVFPLEPGQNRPWKKAYWFRRMALALEPRAVRNAAHILAVSEGTNAGIRERYPELPADRFSSAPFGFEPSDFDALREHPRPNPFWDGDDGCFHLVYAGVMFPHAFGTLRAIFGALLRLREMEPALAARVRLHFIGTTYDPRSQREQILPVAAEMGVADQVTELTRRIPYLDALNVLCRADGVLGLGSSARHYTASKIFPAILSRRPLLAVYHEESSVCDIVREADAGELVTYSDARGAEHHVEEIAAALRRLVRGDTERGRRLSLAALDAYSAETMTRRILAVFDRIAGGTRPRTAGAPVAVEALA